jgi:formimidoylglutamate deiminase
MPAMNAALWFAKALLPNGWATDVRVEIEHGRIARLEIGGAPSPADERHGVAIPGLCNVHSHAFQRGMAGLAEVRGPADDDFWTWREVMYRFLGRLTPEHVEAIAGQAYVEMLQQGFTRVGEFHYVHHAPDGRPYDNPAELAMRIAAAAEATGIGLTLLPVFYAHGDFGGAAPKPSQCRFLNDLNSFATLVGASRDAIAALPDANHGIAPHSLRAVTPDELRALLDLAPDGPVHIHVAEQVKEVEACLAWSGRRPVQWLLNHHDVGARWCLVHATHLDRAELAAVANSGAVAGLCPISEANLGDGIFRTTDYLAAGGRFAVGTDSNIAIDAAGELRLLEYAKRLIRRRRNVLASRKKGASVGGQLFGGAVAGGAQALGLGRDGLRAGTAADIVALDAEHPSLVGRSGDALLDGWIFAAGQGVVDTVWRFGAKVVQGGRHRAADTIAARYRRTIRDLLAA